MMKIQLPKDGSSDFRADRLDFDDIGWPNLENHDIEKIENFTKNLKKNCFAKMFLKCFYDP